MSNVRTALVTASLACSMSIVAAAEREPSIPDQLREAGSFERIIVTTDRPAVLADLVGTADLVVEGSVVAHRTYLDAGEAHIYTDYAFTITDIMKNRRRPGLIKAGQSILIRRESGTVLINGLRATTIENGFPPFANNGRYVLFLGELGNLNTYSVLGSGRGAFEAGDHIAPMTLSPAPGATPVPRQAFLGEMRALLKFSE
jgi:hypothetical protein